MQILILKYDFDYLIIKYKWIRNNKCSRKW
jgi:hypothetical protein